LFMTLEKLRLKPFQMFILGFMFYYGVTFILNLVQGTAIPTAWINALENVPDLGIVLHRIFAFLPQKDIQAYMLLDIPHLIAGIMVGVSLGLCTHALQRGIKFYRYMLRENLFNTSIEEYINLAVQVNSCFKWVWARVIALLLGLAILIAFLLLTNTPYSRMWWGSSNHGIAGYYLSFALAFWVYLATWAGVCFIRALPTYTNFLKKHLCLIRPIWPDGANGLQLWGNTIFEVIFAALGIGMVLLAVSKLGYFGIEKTPYFWAVVFCYFIILPIIFTIPIAPLVANVARSKNKEMDKIAKEIQRRHDLFLTNLADGKLSIKLTKEIDQLQEVYTRIESVSIWPVNKKLIQSSLTTYVIQIGLLVLQKIILR
jgi:hypothetical protein